MPARRWFVIGSPLLLVGCTNYQEAVECAGVYGAFTGQDAGFVEMQRRAERDAAEKRRWAGRTRDQVAEDIKAAIHEKREELAGQSWTTSESRQHCDAFYE